MMIISGSRDTGPTLDHGKRGIGYTMLGTIKPCVFADMSVTSLLLYGFRVSTDSGEVGRIGRLSLV